MLAREKICIDILLVRIHFIIEMIWWTGLAPWEFEIPFPGSLVSTPLGCCKHTNHQQLLKSEGGTNETVPYLLPDSQGQESGLNRLVFPSSQLKSCVVETLQPTEFSSGISLLIKLTEVPLLR